MSLLRLRHVGTTLVLAIVVATGVGIPPTPPATIPVDATTGVPAFNHIFTIVMENQSSSTIAGNTAAPFINGLIAQNALAANYSAVAHPSLPNYLALTGGTTFGVTSDCTDCFQGAFNIADSIQASGRTWKTYQESMPTPCFAGDAYPYAQKHNPFFYYNDIRTNPARCANIVPFTNLASDIASSATTPNFAFITPNLCNDMHDCPIATGDQWLSQTVPAILQSPAFTRQKSLLVLTWDEDEGSGRNQVVTLMVGSGAPAGFRSTVAYTHYSLLKTIEASWNLAPLNAQDAAAAPMSDFFGPPPAPPCTVPLPRPTPIAGYRLAASDGGLFTYGAARFFGSAGGTRLNRPIVGLAATPDGAGYWEVASDGGIFNYGNAAFCGSAGATHLNSPIVGMASVPGSAGGSAGTEGYWEVSADGGIFTYGGATFAGSAGGVTLSRPVVGMAAMPDGKGYWLVAADGGIFNYGDAAFFGSVGGQPTNSPIVGMVGTPDGRGYWEVAADGGVFNYGDAAFFGSAGAVHLNAAIAGIASTPSGRGYWLVASDGGIFNYGDAAFLGSAGALTVNKPIIGIAT